MAKIIIAGDAVVITSSLKFEDIKKVEKYRPDALCLMGGEDGKEPVFRVGTANKGSVSTFGVEFAKATNDEEKLASITLVNPRCDEADVRESVAEDIGPIVMKLNKVEEALPAVLDEINAEKAAILESITVAQ